MEKVLPWVGQLQGMSTGGAVDFLIAQGLSPWEAKGAVVELQDTGVVTFDDAKERTNGA